MQENMVKADLFLPIGAVYHFHDAYRKPAERTVREILLLSGEMRATHLGSQSTPITVTRCALDEAPTDLSRTWTDTPSRPDKILVFSCSAPRSIFDSVPTEGAPTDFDFAPLVLAADLRAAVHRLCILVNLARPGSIETWQGLVISESSREAVRPIRSTIREALADTSWPPILSLRVTTVLEWAERVGWDVNALGETAVFRALNALTYFYGEESGAGDLLYALISLEALYTKGAGIASQLAEKTQVFLGRGEGLKRKIASMYDFRSRFVHGELSFPSAFHSHDAAEEYERYSGELYAATDLAQRLLIATLQKMIARGLTELRFRWALDSSER